MWLMLPPCTPKSATDTTYAALAVRFLAWYLICTFTFCIVDATEFDQSMQLRAV